MLPTRPKRRSSHTVKANNPVSKDFCAKCPRGIQTDMWLQVIFTHSILLCSISLLNWFLSLEQKGWAVGVVSHWNQGGRCSASVGSFYKESLQMKIKTTEFCNKIQSLLRPFSWRLFLLHLSEITKQKVTPAEVPQHDNTFTRGNMWQIKIRTLSIMHSPLTASLFPFRSIQQPHQN